MNNFRFFDEHLLASMLREYNGNVKVIASVRGCDTGTVYAAIRDFRMKQKLKESKLPPVVNPRELDEQIEELLAVKDGESYNVLQYRASQLRIIAAAAPEGATNHALVQSRIEAALLRLRDIARKRIAEELKWKHSV